MNKVKKDLVDGLGRLVDELQSSIGRSDLGAQEWIETDLEFPNGLKYLGVVYDKLRVRTVHNPASTMSVYAKILAPNGEHWKVIGGGPGTETLSHHFDALEKLIRQYLQ